MQFQDEKNNTLAQIQILTVVNQLERSEGYGQGMVNLCYQYLLIISCPISSSYFFFFFWKYVIHLEREIVGRKRDE